MGLHKKVIRAYIQGIEDTAEIWTKIAEGTKGIGPELQKRLLETARRMSAEKLKEREQNGTLGEYHKGEDSGNRKHGKPEGIREIRKQFGTAHDQGRTRQ